MKSGNIQDSQITWSSVWNSNGVPNARLDRHAQGSAGSWSAAVNNINQWIQADLGTVKYVSGIVLQGKHSDQLNQWVTEYKVQYSSDGVTWRYVQDSNRISDMVSSRNVHYFSRFQKNERMQVQ